MARSSAEPFLDTGVGFVAAGWLGMLVGVSFLATPVKFQASSLDLGVALEVGRVTFAAFTRVEWVLCLLVSVAVLWRRPSRAEMLLPAAAVLIVVGWTTHAAVRSPHPLYAVLEAGKALVLGWIAGIALFRAGLAEHAPEREWTGMKLTLHADDARRMVIFFAMASAPQFVMSPPPTVSPQSPDEGCAEPPDGVG